MALTNFKPTIWSDLIYNGYEKAITFSALANRAYEGDIKQGGESVKILSIGSIAPKTYSGTVSYDDVPDTGVLLSIDQAEYAAVKVGDVDKAQATPASLKGLTSELGKAVAVGTDTYIASLHAGAGVKLGTTTTPLEITSADIVETFAELGRKMDEVDAPSDGRVVVVPAWLAEKMVLAKIAKDTANTDVMTRGFIGSLLGFEVYKSNLCAKSGTDWSAAMAFVKGDSIALAQQVVNIEALRDTASFSELVRVLSVYGAKIVNSNGVATIYCAPGTEA